MYTKILLIACAITQLCGASDIDQTSANIAAHLQMKMNKPDRHTLFADRRDNQKTIRTAAENRAWLLKKLKSLPLTEEERYDFAQETKYVDSQPASPESEIIEKEATPPTADLPPTAVLRKRKVSTQQVPVVGKPLEKVKHNRQKNNNSICRI